MGHQISQLALAGPSRTAAEPVPNTAATAAE
jgi:hypothetical protein